MKIAVLGSTGYTGQVLMRLLINHPHTGQIFPVSRSSAGSPVLGNDPGLGSNADEKLEACKGLYISMEQLLKGPAVDLVFAALPHLASADTLGPLFDRTVVIDLSADFRIRDPLLFHQAYGQDPPRPDLLEKAVYGLPEWNREAIKKADLIANPGCYPTASLLPLLPLLAGDAVDSGVSPIIINALSGISGAGRKAKEQLLYCSRTENASAYSPGRSHRHWQEIVHQAVSIAGSNTGDGSSLTDRLFFTPHLIPVHHGMQVSTSLRLKAGVDDNRIREMFHNAYGGSPFIRLRSDMPETSQVRGTNRCDIHIHREGQQLFLFSVIDNLYRGASAQAVQNMNIRFGFREQDGLDLHGEI